MNRQTLKGCVLKFAAFYFFGALATGLAQGIVTTYFDLDELGDIPGVVQVSTDYLTIIEFEGHDVERANTARADLYTLEIVENTVVIRANEDVINTDLYARVAGRTVLFRLESDPTTQNPRRYVVRDRPTPTRGLERQDSVGGAARPERTEAAPLFPLGLQFEAEVLQFRQNEIIIQYRLINESTHPIVNDPLRLRIYYGDTSIDRQIERAPVPGRPNYLAPGEAEAGQILIPKAPSSLSDIELEWILIEVGPGIQHTLVRNLAELAALGKGVLGQTPALPGSNASSEASTPTETDAPASTSAEDGEAESSAITMETESQPEAAVEAETSAEAATENPAAAPTASPVSSEAETDVTSAAEATASEQEPVLVNSTFEEGTDKLWELWTREAEGVQSAATDEVIGGEYCVDVTNSGAQHWLVGFKAGNLLLKEDHSYLLRFDAYADKSVELSYLVSLNVEPWTDHMREEIVLGSEKTSFESRFTAQDFTPQQDEGARMSFFLGRTDTANEAPYRVCFDNIQLASLGLAEGSVDANAEVEAADMAIGSADAAEASPESQDAPAAPESAAEPNPAPAGMTLIESRFDTGIEDTWFFHVHASAEASLENVEGEACITVTQTGKYLSRIGFSQRDWSLEEGQSYTLSFDAYADKSVEISAGVNLQEDPWTPYRIQSETLEPSKQTYVYDFTMPNDETKARVVFEIGGEENAPLTPYRICFDNIMFTTNEVDPAHNRDAELSASSPNPILAEDFESNLGELWKLFSTKDSQAQVQESLASGEYCLTVQSAGREGDSVRLGRFLPRLARGDYTLQFNAYADKPVELKFWVKTEEGDSYVSTGRKLDTTRATYEVDFVQDLADEQDSWLRFNFTPDAYRDQAPYTICLDNVWILAREVTPNAEQTEIVQVSAQESEVLLDSAFDEVDKTWQLNVFEEGGAVVRDEVIDGEYCLTFERPGAEYWHVNINTWSLDLRENERYELSWRGWAERPALIRGKIAQIVEPYAVYGGHWETAIGQEKTLYRHSFTSPASDESALLEFLVGFKDAEGDYPAKVCFDDFKLVTLGANN